MPCACTHCGRALSSQTALARHIAARHPDLATGNLVTCHECRPPKVFAFQSDLQVHHKAVHAGVRSFECKECGRCFSRRSHLRSHQSTVHNKSKRFKCTLCGKQMSQHGHLLNHVRRDHSSQVAEAGGDASKFCVKAKAEAGQDEASTPTSISSSPAAAATSMAASASAPVNGLSTLAAVAGWGSSTPAAAAAFPRDVMTGGAPASAPGASPRAQVHQSPRHQMQQLRPPAPPGRPVWSLGGTARPHAAVVGQRAPVGAAGEPAMSPRALPSAAASLMPPPSSVPHRHDAPRPGVAMSTAMSPARPASRASDRSGAPAEQGRVAFGPSSYPTALQTLPPPSATAISDTWNPPPARPAAAAVAQWLEPGQAWASEAHAWYSPVHPPAAPLRASSPAGYPGSGFPHAQHPGWPPRAATTEPAQPGGWPRPFSAVPRGFPGRGAMAARRFHLGAMPAAPLSPPVWEPHGSSSSASGSGSGSGMAFRLRPSHPRGIPSPWAALRSLGDEPTLTKHDTRSVGAAVAAVDPSLSMRAMMYSPPLVDPSPSAALSAGGGDSVRPDMEASVSDPSRQQRVAILLPSESSSSQDGTDSPNGVWLPHSSATVSTIVASLGPSGVGGGDDGSGSNGNTRSSNEVSATVTADSRDESSGKKGKSKSRGGKQKKGKKDKKSRRSGKRQTGEDASESKRVDVASSPPKAGSGRSSKAEGRSARGEDDQPPAKRAHRESSDRRRRKGSSRSGASRANPKAMAVAVPVPSLVRPDDLYLAADAFGRGSVVVPRSLGRIGAVAIPRMSDATDERRAGSAEAAAANRRAAVVVVRRPAPGQPRFDLEARRPILSRWTLPAEARPPAAGFDPPTAK